MNSLFSLFEECRRILRQELGIVQSECIAIQVNEFFGWAPQNATPYRIVAVYLDHKACDPPLELDCMLTVDEPDYEQAHKAFVGKFIPKLKQLLKGARVAPS